MIAGDNSNLKTQWAQVAVWLPLTLTDIHVASHFTRGTYNAF